MSEPVEPNGPVLACTVSFGYDRPAATALARSYLAHHSDHRFVVLLLDDRATDETDGRCRTVGGDWLSASAPDYYPLATALPATELADAAIPRLLRALLGDADVVLYLGVDGVVLGSLDDVAAAATERGVAALPANLAPLPDDGHRPDEQDTIALGALNPGFLAVGAAGRPFLDYWADRAGRLPAPRVLPRWLDRLPALFPHTLLRDPGLGVNYRNLHERPLGGMPGARTAGGAPLRFLQFPGFRPERPWLLSDDCTTYPRVTLAEQPILRELCDDYREGLPTDPERESAFDVLPDGTELSIPVRTLYRTTWQLAVHAEREPSPFTVTADEVPPHPFGPDDGAAFTAWLAEPSAPAELAAGLNRLTMWFWDQRPDLQRVFPHPLAEDAPGFRDWCRRHGVDEGLPQRALPTEPRPLPPPDRDFGVNVVGYLTAELGLGEMGRIVLRAIERAGVPTVSVVEQRSLAGNCRTSLDAPESSGRPRFGVSLLAVNGDYTEITLANHPEVGSGRHRIGLWAWELEDFPPEQHAGFEHVDEIWTVSRFCRDAIAPHSPVPVKVIPVPVTDPGPVTRASRVAGEPVRFLFAFDFNSTGQRKNPWGLVTAFQRSFPDRDDVRLVVKATNGHRHAEARERLLRVIGDDKRIELLERYLSTAELDELYRTSDAYVSLHRSEGFGLTVAEAMVRGLAVIATGYGATTEFFDDEVGWTVPHRMVEVGPGWAPYQEDGRWADPDLDAAADAMRAVADNPEEAHRRGSLARERLLRDRSSAKAEAWLREQLHAAHDQWLTDLDAAPAASPLRRLAGRALDRLEPERRQTVRKQLGRVERVARRALRRGPG